MAWLGAFSIGLSLGLLGSGGSILTVPVLVYLVDVPEKTAIAESLAIVGLIAAGGAVPRALAGLVDWRQVVLFGLPGMLGAYLGAAAGEYVSAALQLTLFALVMLVAAYLMARPTRQDAEAPEVQRPDPPRQRWKIASEGLVVGAVTGLVGVGGGFLIVPALVILGRLPMHRAIGTSLAIIALKSGSGFAKYRDVLAELGQSVDWIRIGLFAGLGLLGTLVGARLADRMPRLVLRRLFAAFLVLMGLWIVWQYAPQLMR